MRVQGEGPADATVVFVGEAPGVDEERTGRPFVGKAGRELDRFLNGYDLPSRDEVFITNVVRERPVTAAGQNREPTPAEIARDWPELELELGIIEPETIVTLGRTSTRLFLGDVDLETVHGLPHQLDGRTIFPTYHPAAALHSPELQALLAYDMQRLSLFLHGELPPTARDGAPGLYGEEETPTLDSILPLAIDTEGWVERPWCLSFSQRAGEGWVCRRAFPITSFAAQVGRHRGPIYLHNALHDLGVLRAMGITLPHFTDTMILAYLLGLEPQGLKPLAYRHAGMVQASYEEIIAIAQATVETDWLTRAALPEKVKARGWRSKVGIRQWWASQKPATVALVTEPIPEATLDDVEKMEPGRAVQYAARDADCTLRIALPLTHQIEAMGLSEVAEVDCAIVPMIDRMQTVGIKADLDHFRDLSALIDLHLSMLRSQIESHAGTELNPGSPKQVEALLFGKLHLPRGKRTKSGEHYSTADAHLEAIREYHPIVGLLLDWREAAKLKGTYVDPMPSYIQADGRLHPKFRITRVSSGRLAASDPNVLAFPKHSELGKLVRMGFLADEGHLLGEWDLDQIEMRVMAHDSGDETMIAEFLSGVDKHTSTASRIFGIPIDRVKGEQRFAAKAVNFGILMGMTRVGLRSQFHKNGQRQWTEEDCQKLLDEYFRIYTGVAAYVSGKHAEARRYGYVRDMWGRIRYLAGVHSPDARIREEALRQAQATPIQSGAQGIIKRIMRALWPEIVKLRREVWVEPLLQIHDALIFEFEREVHKLLDTVVMHAMHETVMLRIPVTAKAAAAERWGQL
jgi:uracil-DNA glycosylase family 4